MNRYGRWLAALLLVALAAGALALRSSGRGEPRVRLVRYAPADSVPRPALEYSDVAGVAFVREFDGDSARLFLLDPMSTQVHVVGRTAGAWRLEKSFGRRGGGPGEFVSPTGIALLPGAGRIAVADAGRIHFFDLEGVYQESTAPRDLCNVHMPRLASGAGGLFLYGACAEGDSIFDVLFWSQDGAAFVPVAHDFRSTARGRGGMYGATNPFAEGVAGSAFGSGVSGCVFTIGADAPPRAQRRCIEDFAHYRLEFSPETLKRMEARRARSKNLSGIALPERHPAFMHALVLPEEGAVLLRSYEEDSLVARPVASAADLAVLPLPGLVGCRRAGCLYAEPALEAMRLAFLRAQSLRR